MLVARTLFVAARRSGMLLRSHTTQRRLAARRLAERSRRGGVWHDESLPAELCFGFAQQRVQLGMPHAVRAWGAWLRLDGLVVSVGFRFVVRCGACTAPAAC